MIMFNKTPILMVFVLLVTVPNFGQHSSSKTDSDKEIRQAAQEIMKASGTCALITIDEQEIPRVRMMDTLLPDSDFSVWFGTNPKSRKVAQIKNNPKVTLYYTAAGNSGYVTLHGEAFLINDEQEKEKRWKHGWEAFYPDKKESFILIKVIPKWLEVVSFTHGLIGDENTWVPPVVTFN